MNRLLTRTGAATLVAGTLLAGSIASPATMADSESPGLVATVAAANPLAPQQADAAWYDFTIRAKGGVCGYRETVQVGQGYYRHRVMRNIKTWTSSNWQCAVMDEWVTNRTPRPYVGMPGGAR